MRAVADRLSAGAGS